ncbi:hypothetical protein CVIRNUC_008315 [Coccomyxa viridis]|uniref:Malectin domain-containing protein n=1 Tax=Coccomyxa viridis TaxID=1274662 RepID=A0AAV1IDG0_9CHLO|nr:hypothetical protein CVIRNUC_008315 [Coccomyxa viridis]
MCLQSGASYAVSLLFCELYFSDAIARLFNVTFNGQQNLLSDFSILQAAGGKDIAYDASFTLTADPAGTLTFLFIALKDNAIVSGFEIRDASPPTASPSQAPAGSLQPGAPIQAPVLLQQPSAAAPGQLQALPHVAPSYTAPVLAPLQLPDWIAIPPPAPAPVLTRLPPSPAQAPLPRSARPPILAPAPVAALSGPPVPGQPQPPVLAPTPGASLPSSSTAAPQPSPGIMLPPSPALAPSQAEPLKVFLTQSGSPNRVTLPAQVPQQGPPLAPALAPQAGPGLVTPALAVSATDVNQSTASTVSSQVSTSTVTVTTTVTTQGPPAPTSSGSSPADLSPSKQSVNAEGVSAVAASAAAEEDTKYVHFTKGQVAGLIIGLWLGLGEVDTVTLVVAILAIKVHRAQESI